MYVIIRIYIYIHICMYVYVHAHPSIDRSLNRSIDWLEGGLIGWDRQTAKGAYGKVGVSVDASARRCWPPPVHNPRFAGKWWEVVPADDVLSLTFCCLQTSFWSSLTLHQYKLAQKQAFREVFRRFHQVFRSFRACSNLFWHIRIHSDAFGPKKFVKTFFEKNGNWFVDNFANFFDVFAMFGCLSDLLMCIRVHLDVFV